MSGQYPQDEFDDIPPGGPVGIHRKPRSPWRAVLPFFIVLLLVPLLAWGVTALVRNRVSDEEIVFVEDEQSLEQVQSEPVEEEIVVEGGAEADPEDGPTAAPDDPAAVDEVPEEEPAEVEGEVFYDTTVAVLNASGIPGYAGSSTEQLIAAGFVNSWAGNSSDTLTAQNTVYYSGPDLAATAQAVGQVLGIDVLVEDAVVTGGPGIVVLLRD